MIKKLLSACFVLVMSTSLYAIDWNSQSLVGLEFGYGQMEVKGKGSQYTYKNNFDVVPLGIKLGAKNEYSRLFFSARYLYVPDFNYSLAYGAELQYLFPVAKVLDLFLGGNIGYVSFNFDANDFNNKAKSTKRNASTVYFGGDAGLNINFTSYFALELGARYMYMNKEHIKDNESYTIRPITQGYLSLIYKYYSEQ